MRTTIIFLLSVFIFLFALNMFSATPPSYNYHYKFVLVGGGDLPEVAKKHFINFAGGRDAHILIIPSASRFIDKSIYMQMWNTDVASVGILHASNRAEANDPNLYSRIRAATGVWISGGDQKKLDDIYRGTPVVDELKSLLNRNGVIGGTSAGASIVGQIMPYEDEEMCGFGLIDNFIVDQHFTNRQREPRLKKIVDNHPGMVGIGIDENTALIIRDQEMKVVGDGGVSLLR